MLMQLRRPATNRALGGGGAEAVVGQCAERCTQRHAAAARHQRLRHELEGRCRPDLEVVEVSAPLTSWKYRCQLPFPQRHDCKPDD